MSSRILYTPTQEKRKRKLPSRRSIFIMLAVLGFLGITVGVFSTLQAPYFKIRFIKVYGLISLNEDEVREKISAFLDEKISIFFSQRSFFFLRSSRAELFLQESFPRIAAVAVVKIFPQELTVEISERKLWGIFCNDFKIETPPEEGTAEKDIQVKNLEPKIADCAYVDNMGFAYESAPESSGSLLIKIHGDGETKIPSQVVPEELSRKMSEFGEELKRVFGIDAIGYEFSSQIPREFRVLTSDSFSLWINRDDDFAGVVKILKTVLDEEIKDRQADLDYADLRFGSKVFYKFRQK